MYVYIHTHCIHTHIYIHIVAAAKFTSISSAYLLQLHWSTIILLTETNKIKNIKNARRRSVLLLHSA